MKNFEIRNFYALFSVYFQALVCGVISFFLVFLIPAVLFLLLINKFNPFKKKFLYLAIFFLIGAFPLIIYNITSPWKETLKYLHREATTSSAWRFDISYRFSSFLSSLKGILFVNFYEQPYKKYMAFSVHFFSLIPRRFSISYISSMFNFFLLLLASLYFFFSHLRNIFSKNKRETGFYLFLYFAVFAILGYILSAESPASRHLVPLFFLIPVIYALFIHRIYLFSKLTGLMLIALLLFSSLASDLNITKNFLSHQNFWNGIVNFLFKNRIHFVETDYWIAYKLTFISDEKVIAVSSLGLFKFPRYLPYYKIVQNASLENKGFIIYSEDIDFKREVKSMLKSQNIKFRYKESNGIGVFYRLSKRGSE